MSNIPTTPVALRLHALFSRRPQTEWSSAEVKEYKTLVKAKAFDELNDLSLIERYYFAERKKGKDGVHRRDLLRLLKYWSGEVDRAVEWSRERSHRLNGSRALKSKENQPQPLSETEFSEAGRTGLEMLAKWKQTLRR